MALTPETLTRHELNGLLVEVVDAHNPDLIGISGRVVGETTQTLSIDGSVEQPSRQNQGGSSAESKQECQSRVRMVPKLGTTFEFTLTDEAADRPTTGHRHKVGRKGSGTTSKRELETASTPDDTVSSSSAGQSGSCEGVAYVTVDGARLLSRPARRTETGGVSKWQSD